MSESRLEFYQILATIIPVLLLAITLQSGSFIKSLDAAKLIFEKVLQAFSICGVFLLLITSEAFILYGLYNNTEENINLLAIGMSIGLALAYIIIDYILAIFSKPSKAAIYWIVLSFALLITHAIQLVTK